MVEYTEIHMHETFHSIKNNLSMKFYTAVNWAYVHWMAHKNTKVFFFSFTKNK